MTSTINDHRDEAVALVRKLANGYGCAPERIREMALEIIATIDPSPDLKAARDLAAGAVLATAKGHHGRALFVLSDNNGRELYRDDAGAITARIMAGQADESTMVLTHLAGITKGRELAASEAEEQRLTDMIAPPRATPPSDLTVTIDGPQGSGKTKLGAYLRQVTALGSWPAYIALPRIVEIRDGRRFDVRNDAFLEG